MYKSR